MFKKTIKAQMGFVRETKGALLYREIGSFEIGVQYFRKNHFGDERPKMIDVTIQIEQVGRV